VGIEVIVGEGVTVGVQDDVNNNKSWVIVVVALI
jgi:hypothetical protein